METEKIVEFKIHRFNPKQKKQYVSIYKVPVRRGTTILEALFYIKDNLDETLTFRHSCGMGICGSCGIMVNDKPMLACYTQVLHLDQFRTVKIDTASIYTLVPQLETYKSEIASQVRRALEDPDVDNPLTVFYPGLRVTFPNGQQ